MKGMDPAVKLVRVVEAKVGMVDRLRVLPLQRRLRPAVIRDAGLVKKSFQLVVDARRGMVKPEVREKAPVVLV